MTAAGPYADIAALIEGLRVVRIVPLSALPDDPRKETKKKADRLRAQRFRARHRARRPADGGQP